MYCTKVYGVMQELSTTLEQRSRLASFSMEVVADKKVMCLHRTNQLLPLIFKSLLLGGAKEEGKMAGKRRSASFPILSDDGDSDALSSGYSAFTDSFIDRKRDEESRLASQGAESADSIPLVDISERDEEQPVKKRRKRITPNTKLKHKRRRRRSTVHDAFIESSKNTPHYVKEENSNNLLA